MRRLVAALADSGDRLLFLFSAPSIPDAVEGQEQSAVADQPVIELIERGQTDGTFDPAVSAHWVEHSLWALVVTACELADKGKLPRHGVTATVIRTLENGIHTRH